MIIIERSPHSIEDAYNKLCTESCLKFLEDIVEHFDEEFDELLKQRASKRTENVWEKLNEDGAPDEQWQVMEHPEPFTNPGVHLGNCSPANKISFLDAIYSTAQAIQIDFDDGNCPTWRNTIQGLYNIKATIDGTLQGIPIDKKCYPAFIFMLRPLNLVEHHCMINGKEVLGSLFDFSMIMFHNAKQLSENHRGPFLCLSKLECAEEVQLWIKVLAWTESKLNIEPRKIKIYITIDCIYAGMNIKAMLCAGKGYIIAMGLNKYNYAASIISNYAESKMDLFHHERYLKVVMKNLINICNHQNLLVWKEMNYKMLSPGKGNCKRSLEIIGELKGELKSCIEMGFKSFAVYDVRLVSHLNEVNTKTISVLNTIKVSVTESFDGFKCLQKNLDIENLRHMIAITLLFIYHWLSGEGVFYYNQNVINSAIVEVCRSQLWLYVRKRFAIKTTETFTINATRNLVYQHLNEIVSNLQKTICITPADQKRLLSSKYIFLDIISSRNSIQFITTYLNDNHKFRTLHNKSDGLQSML